VSTIIPAASVLLSKGPDSPQVFLIRRSDALPFFGGFWAFPGGKVGDEDRNQEERKHEFPNLRALKVTAVRELFEETGILLARHADGSFPSPSPILEDFRRLVLDGKARFTELLQQMKLEIRDEDLISIGEVTTPEFVPMRFATTFFVAQCPPIQEPEVWPGELAEGRWASAHDMIQCWNGGECLVSPPTIMTLQSILNSSPMEAPVRLGPLLSSLAQGKIHPIFFAPDIQLIPLRTMALPPSTHTNAYLVGSGPRYLIDPGPHDPAEQKKLFDLIDEQLALGKKLTAIVLSHHHPDHIGAVSACVERYRLPVWAHPWTAEKLQSKIPVTKTIEEGDHLDLGPCPAEGRSWFLEVLHTPGHAPGHLVFHEPFYRLLLVGDMVSTVSSIIIAPPEGDLTIYLESLKRLQKIDCRLLLPSHGNVSSRPGKIIEEAIAHRQKREEQLLIVLKNGCQSLEELTPELYRGLPVSLMKFARLQTLAGLEKLLLEGKVMKSDNRWELIPRVCGEV
jgi:glyoxylase-like metal-dependent hydrolase (beta-lactamase superfamily II)/8-oxo-dGTP pyrophosphatase MutT (NUDIX family)